MAKTVGYCQNCIMFKDVPLFPGGIFDYVYGCWWKCRTCGRWCEHTPKL